MRTTLFALLLLLSWLSGCAPNRGFDAQLKSMVKPYRFSIARWELRALPAELAQRVSGQANTSTGAHVVREYFSSVARIKALKSEIAATSNRTGDLARLKAELERLEEQTAALASAVEKIIERQIRQSLSDLGIFNPVVELRVAFPPISFRLEKPPCLLVVSPRHRIESMREVVLVPGLVVDEMERIEDSVDKLGVSSLVVELGGLATYPSLVASEASLKFTMDTITEEWLHHYLLFKPLGFRYLLNLTGLARNYEIATLSETVASMVGKEISALVIEKYYPGYENGVGQDEAESGFDFNREMREIRRTVDRYLAEGKIEPAEQFMEEKRQYLVTMGYHIRKLNQAYFAFHGAYADRPTSISPIGRDLKKLREQSASLKDFLNTAATITSLEELAERTR